MIFKPFLEQAARHYAQAKEHIDRGAELIMQQHQIVGRLRCRGHDTTEAERLLRNLEVAQTLHILVYDEVKKELQG